MTAAELIEQFGFPREDTTLFGGDYDYGVRNRSSDVNTSFLFTRLDAWARVDDALWVSWINGNGANYARLWVVPAKEMKELYKHESKGEVKPSAGLAFRIMCGKAFDRAFDETLDRHRIDHAYKVVKEKCARMLTRLTGDKEVIDDRTTPATQSGWRQIHPRHRLLAFEDPKGVRQIAAIFTVDTGNQYPRTEHVGRFMQTEDLESNLCSFINDGSMSHKWDDHLVRPNSYSTDQQFPCGSKKAYFHVCENIFKQSVGNRELVAIARSAYNTQLVSRYKNGNVILSSLYARACVRQMGLLGPGDPGKMLELLESNKVLWKDGLDKAQVQDIVSKLQIRHTVKSIMGG